MRDPSEDPKYTWSINKFLHEKLYIKEPKPSLVCSAYFHRNSIQYGLRVENIESFSPFFFFNICLTWFLLLESPTASIWCPHLRILFTIKHNQVDYFITQPICNLPQDSSNLLVIQEKIGNYLIFLYPYQIEGTSMSFWAAQYEW